jgi:hypothetical protein
MLLFYFEVTLLDISEKKYLFHPSSQPLIILLSILVKTLL